MQETAVTHTRLKQLLIGTLIASLCVAAAVAIAAILADTEIDETTGRLLGTVAALTVYSLAGLACNSLRPRRPDLRWLGDLGLSVCLLGFGLALVGIWSVGDSDGPWQAAAVALTISLALAHTALLLRSENARLGEAARLLRAATIGVTSLLAGLLVLEILSTNGEAVEWRVVAVVAVLFLLGNVLFPLVRLMEPRQ